MANAPIIHRLACTTLILLTLSGCASSAQSTPLIASTVENSASPVPTDRSSNAYDDSHSKDADPNYAVVFPQDSVNRIDITLTDESWDALQTEMEEQFGPRGSGNRQGPGGQGFDRQNPPGDRQQPGQGGFQPGGRPDSGGWGKLDFGDTSYVTSTISFNGETWQNVGFRYSGNSTLQQSWSSGTQKISFRLDFDEFENADSSITDQRFYGFKQISFKSNAMDSSYIREKVTADIFREAGVVSSQTAFYEVYIDYGDGPQYFGLYTAVEIVDDTVIETQFGDGSGNVYKPEGSGAAFVDGTFSQDSFEKQTNEDQADWSDIQAVFAALNSPQRTTNPEAWRLELESVFDVDAFIRWLAVDTIVQNWDTYGAMAHNYYLYTDPSDGLVTWIPWDNNMALSASSSPDGNRGGGFGGGRMGSVRDLDLESVGDQWPLIRYLMDDPVYKEKYNQYLAETIQGAFEPEKMTETYQKYHDLIAPYVEKEEEGFTQLNSIQAFNNSVSELIQHARSRADAVTAYLAAQ